MAGDAEDLGAGVARPADAGEPRRAALQDRGRGRDRLDIVDGRRTAIKPDSRRKGRLQPRHALLAFEAFEERRFLAANVGAGAAVQINLDVIAGAAGILTNEAGGIGLLDRRLQPLRLGVEFAADVDVGGGASHPGPGQHAAFEQFVRLVAQDVAVLAGARLALIGIDDEIAGPVALLRHEGPFEAGRETGAAAAAQPGFLDLVNDPVAALENYLARAVPIAAAPRAGEAPIAVAIEVREDAIAISEHRRSLWRRPRSLVPRSASSCRRPAPSRAAR